MRSNNAHNKKRKDRNEISERKVIVAVKGQKKKEKKTIKCKGRERRSSILHPKEECDECIQEKEDAGGSNCR